MIAAGHQVDSSPSRLPHLCTDIYSHSIPSKHLFFRVYVRFDHKFTGPVDLYTQDRALSFLGREHQWVQLPWWELTKVRAPLSRLLDWTLPFPPSDQSAQSPGSCPGPFPSWPNLSPESPKKSSLSMPGMRQSTFVSESLTHFLSGTVSPTISYRNLLWFPVLVSVQLHCKCLQSWHGSSVSFCITHSSYAVNPYHWRKQISGLQNF